MKAVKYFPNIPIIITPQEATTVAEEMKVLSRRSCNDLARLENHHDIDPATLGIHIEHWLLGTGDSDEDECVNDNIIID